MEDIGKVVMVIRKLNFNYNFGYSLLRIFFFCNKFGDKFFKFVENNFFF